ncbi:DNA-packaging protein [Yoonia sp. 208BN28-4]|uniref:DNA-packaging protein n=1 Tax=Yoonia sp. 208BN28-4 TaxID=3126505 RepID=UPI00309FA853
MTQRQTLTTSALKSGACLIASATPQDRATFLNSLTDDQIAALPYLFTFWAMPHQLPPEGDWRTWVIMGGRGAGKTRAGAEWVRGMAEGVTPRAAGRARRIAIVGETFDQAREVMIFGDSGIMAVSPASQRPKWIAGRKQLQWPNGAVAQVCSAHDPESLRGPQFDALWADELAKWAHGHDSWDMLQFALRLGEHPQACVTTTPRNVDVLKDLLARDSTVMTHAPTEANAANLAKGFIDEVQAKYGGTRLGRQELEGKLLADVAGALWTPQLLADAQSDQAPHGMRVVVAVDPAVSSHSKSDACGIIVAGALTDGPVSTWRAFVIEDATVQGATPSEWAAVAVEAFERHSADKIVAEVNQGGGLVESVIRQISDLIPFKALHASKGKARRAEPVAALYEQGRVQHLRGLGQLEDQMCAMTTSGFQGKGSPDRVDALVWALHELMIAPSLKAQGRPQVRGLGR